MSRAESPRGVVNAGELIGKALAPKQLALLIKLVQNAKASGEEEAGTASITLGKLRKALKWKTHQARTTARSAMTGAVR
ncbi:MAG TPA: hypothetical protein VME21_04370 [Steroidobacteraceae bacterium]|nr:hypothetical protein [Steroidobacteraceae bacterium]